MMAPQAARSRGGSVRPHGSGRRCLPQLACDHVDKNRAAEPLGGVQRVLELFEVVSVNRAQVLQTEVLKPALRADDVLDALLQTVQCVVCHLAGDAKAWKRLLAPGQYTLVLPRGAQRVEVLGEPTNGWRVRASVVVYHHDKLAVLALGNVVERLPSHAAG